MKIKLTMKSTYVPLFSALTCFLGSYISAEVLLAAQNQFGRPDIKAFLFWTFFLSLGIGLVGLTLHLIKFRIPVPKSGLLKLLVFSLSPIIGGFIGVGIGIAWTLTLYNILGILFAAFSFPVSFCWVLGSAIGCSFATSVPIKNTASISPRRLVLATVGIITVIITSVCLVITFLFLSDLRPAGMTGAIECKTIEDSSSTSLKVYLILDQAAVKQRSKLKIISHLQETPKPGVTYINFQADFGAANGSIHGCGSVKAKVIKISITDQMLSYPSWLRLISYEPVEVIIVDDLGNNLAESIVVNPGQEDVNVKWLRQIK